MKKKILIISGVLILLGIIYFGIYFIQNITLTNSFSKEFNEDFEKNNTYFIRCNYNIFNPEFAYVSEIGGGLITFQRSKKMFYQTEKEWDENEIGGTTVQNTTFKNLLSMVKNDCYQFQKNFNWNNRNKGELSWGYSPYDYKEEKEQKEEEKEWEKKEKERIRKEREYINNMTEEERKIFIKKLEEENKKAEEINPPALPE